MIIIYLKFASFSMSSINYFDILINLKIPLSVKKFINNTVLLNQFEI